MAKEKKSKEDRRTTTTDRSEARMKQYVLYAAGLALTLPFLVPLLFRLANWISPPNFTKYVDPTPSQLHQIFFSGEPHIIFCTNSTGSDLPRLIKRVSDVATLLSTPTTVAADDQVDDPLALTKKETAVAYKRGVLTSPIRRIEVGTLDCAAALPSGKSVLQRFGLTLPAIVLAGGGAPPSATGAQGQQVSTTAQALPPAFFVGGGERPRFLPNDLFLVDERQMPTTLVEYALTRMQAKTVVIQTEKALASRCTSRKACVLLLHAGTSNLLAVPTARSVRALHRALPAIPIGTIDVRGYTLDLQRNLGRNDDAAQAKWPRLLFFRRQAAAAAAGVGGKASTLYVKSYKGAWTPDDVVSFVASLTDTPAYLLQANSSSTAAGTSDPAAATSPADHPKTSQMAVLKRAPVLNYGAENFKLPAKVGSAKKKNRQAPTQQQVEKAQADAKRRASAADEADVIRDAEMKRRDQMEAEAAQHLVHELDADENGEKRDEESGEEEAEEEEVVSLDEDRADL